MFVRSPISVAYAIDRLGRKAIGILLLGQLIGKWRTVFRFEEPEFKLGENVTTSRIHKGKSTVAQKAQTQTKKQNANKNAKRKQKGKTQKKRLAVHI